MVFFLLFKFFAKVVKHLLFSLKLRLQLRHLRLLLLKVTFVLLQLLLNLSELLLGLLLLSDVGCYLLLAFLLGLLLANPGLKLSHFCTFRHLNRGRLDRIWCEDSGL